MCSILLDICITSLFHLFCWEKMQIICQKDECTRVYAKWCSLSCSLLSRNQKFHWCLLFFDFTFAPLCLLVPLFSWANSYRSLFWSNLLCILKSFLRKNFRPVSSILLTVPHNTKCCLCVISECIFSYRPTTKKICLWQSRSRPCMHDGIIHWIIIL